MVHLVSRKFHSNGFRLMRRSPIMNTTHVKRQRLVSRNQLDVMHIIIAMTVRVYDEAYDLYMIKIK